ncbi:UNVERIFIED_CONTAM: hypothetical protein GTU68_042293 [Idotea baltica]|nr:hypothetical protein [Idotea baltica]
MIGVKVPIPKDMSGGYTHERHKQNFFILQKAGDLYSITGKEKYAKYIKENFYAYAEMFPTLPIHPTDRSYATGKLFWQCLNDANWLVYCSQAYESIYDYLSQEERAHLESKLFRPLADFLSVENPQFYNRIHNHSTWGNAAVGMIGLVMKDEELVHRALYGLEGERRAGFLAQLDLSFSPDGHFTEGPYYLRYAMTPFLLFAKALSKSRPDLNIYGYRDNILQKAVYALLYETDAQGRFFPINDSQKGMSWLSREVVAAVDIAYSDFGKDPMLLSIAQKQGRVLLDETGAAVSEDIEKGLATPFSHKSIAYVDGADGTMGGLGILRAETTPNNETCVVMKYAAHGMGHGHFDKLSYSLFCEAGEVIQDYGAARWVNIDQKGGGRYLKENQTFAKHSIAHNTVVFNEKSHYNADVKIADAKSPDLYYFNIDDENVQVSSAKEQYAYPGSELQRTLLLLKLEEFGNPILVDVFKVTSEEKNQYDLPTWFIGHLLSTNFEYKAETTSLATLGSEFGYQHIWKEASGSSKSGMAQFTWFGDGNFYTQSSASDTGDELIFGRPGANDPEFNLRHDPVFVHRKKNTSNTVYASVIESHGTYSTVTEVPLNPFPSITSVEVLHDDQDYTAVSFSDDSNTWQVLLANNDASKTSSHKLEINNKSYSWQGPFEIIKTK